MRQLLTRVALVTALVLAVGGLAGPARVASTAAGTVEVAVSEVDLDGPAISPVTVTITNGAARALTRLEVTFAGPVGWAVAPERVEIKGSLRPGHTVTARFDIQVPEPREGFRVHTFRATATYGGGDGAGTATGVRHQQTGEPLPDLAAAYNNVGVTDESNTAPGEFDAEGNSFSAQKLADVGIVPGGTVTALGADFVWPDVPAGTPDNVASSGQAIDLDGQGSRIAFLGSGSSFNAAGTVRVYYTDGISTAATVGFPNWSFQDAGAHGATLVAATNGRNRPDGYGNAGIDYRIFANSVPVDPTRTVDLVVLPSSPTFHVFDMALVP